MGSPGVLQTVTAVLVTGGHEVSTLDSVDMQSFSGLRFGLKQGSMAENV